MAIEVFNRYEKKYRIRDDTYHKLRAALEEYMESDAHSKNGEFYTICNIYYDTPDNYLIRKSIDGSVYKEKLRLRSYGTVSPEDKVFLEIKKKYKGVVYKRRIKLPYKEAVAYIYDDIPPSKTGQIFNEIDYFIKFYGCKPKLFLSYDRVALCGVGDEKDLRITFDRNIRSRTDRLDLSIPPDGEPLLETGLWLMEIKAPGAMPLWLTDILTRLKIYPTSFSKYGRIYTRDERRKQQKGENELCLQAY